MWPACIDVCAYHGGYGQVELEVSFIAALSAAHWYSVRRRSIACGGTVSFLL